MEWKIGEINQVNGEWYQCIVGNGCENCAFNERKCYTVVDNGDPIGDCCADRRKDNKDVIFKKLEKVGEPYEFDGHIFQSYHTFEVPIFTENYATVREYGNNSKISIEIKQNKEDMEEKVQCCDNRFEIIAKAKEALLKETNIARDEQEMAVIDNILFRCWQMGWLDKYDDTKHSNSEKIGKNLRPFDLQKAREGKPVCTRDGRKARIICFDKKGAYPIVALVNDYNEEEYIKNYDEFGKKFIGGETSDDLMMLPEKKEGWINVYKERCYETKEEAIRHIAPGTHYIDTIRVKWEDKE